LSTLSPELSGKRLEILKEVILKLSRVAFFGNSNAPANAQTLKETEVAAGAFGLQIQYLEVQSPKEIEPAFQAAAWGVLKYSSSSGTLLPLFITYGSQSLR
jgi:putative tryptophan/tyrosine transport system substrate-binding protein